MEDEQDSWPRIFSDLVTLVESAPSPPRRPVGEWERKDQSEAHAVAVAWGWLMRLKRTGEAVFELEKAGYGAEAPPLVRSVVEHAVRLPWAADLGRQEFVEILIRMRRWSLQNTLDAAEAGWPLTEDQIRQIRDLQDEAGLDFISLDRLAHITNVAKADPGQFAQLYQVWLSETQETHPSLQSSANYRQQSDDDLTWTLHVEPKPHQRRYDVLIPSLLWIGLGGYARVAGLEEHFAAPIEDIGGRMEALGT